MILLHYAADAQIQPDQDEREPDVVAIQYVRKSQEWLAY